ncbi:MAG TPA: copper resistance protein NlpE, partial [Saprospiraceae bacterium]|nr:copper resistance protein NlpE [Saprospiraceae bacterium]
TYPADTNPASVSSPTAPTTSNSNPSQVVSASSANGKDWPGTYMGTLPCADCAGIQKVITLYDDNSFKLKTQYLGNSSAPFDLIGTFNWDATGTIITLVGAAGQPNRFKVLKDQLLQLDQNGNAITGPLAGKYILQKTK